MDITCIIEQELINKMQFLSARIVAGACTSLNIVQLFAAILIARLHIFLIYYSVKNKGMWRCMYVAFSSFMSNDGKKSEFGKKNVSKWNFLVK